MTLHNHNQEGQLRRIKMWHKADKEHCKKFHDAAKEDFEFLSGKQWTEKEERSLKAQLRPIITFNRTNPIIQSVSGMEISNRKEVKFFPREAGDAKPNELLTDAAKWFRDQADADDEDSDAFLDSTVCGLGVTETGMVFEENEAGDPSMSSVNPLEVMWDKSARKKNFTDARRKWRIRKIPIAEAMDMFDGVSRDDLDAKWASLDGGADDTESQEEANRYEGESDDMAHSEDDVTIVHLQYKEKIKVRKVMDMSTGKVTDVPDKDLKKLLERGSALGVSYNVIGRRTKTVVRNTFIGSKILTKSTESLGGSHFSFNFITAYIDRVTGMPYGLMRMMKDPQKWANKWMSQALHILNTNAKGGVMYEEGSIDDIRTFEKNWARNDKAVKVNAGALTSGQVKEKTMSQMPSGFFQMMEFAIGSVRDVTGISLELMGNREASQAASLEFQRRQAGMSLLSPLFDNLKRYRREQGKLMLHIIQNYLSDGRMIRIVGKDNAQYAPLTKQADVEYDIIVDDQANSPDTKMMIWKLLTPLLPTLPSKIQLALLDYAPLPTGVIDKIKEVAKTMGPSEAVQEAQKIEMAGNAAEVEKTKSETAENMAQAAKIQQELQQPQQGGGIDMAEVMRIRQHNQIAQQRQASSDQTAAARLAMQDGHFQQKLASDQMNSALTREQDMALQIVKASVDAQNRG